MELLFFTLLNILCEVGLGLCIWYRAMPLSDILIMTIIINIVIHNIVIIIIEMLLLWSTVDPCLSGLRLSGHIQTR